MFMFLLDSLNFFQLLPLHCAAINPNTKYLQKLFAVVPDYQVKDCRGRKLIHYAAACEGSGPLKFLLTRYISYVCTFFP